MTRNTDAIAARTGASPDAARDMMVQMNRHKRLITPEEVAALKR